MADPVRAALHTLIANTASVTSLLSVPGAVHHQQAPRDVTPPFVVFNEQSGVRRWAFDGAATSSEVWQVKAIDHGNDAGTAEDIDAALGAALDGATLAITGHTHHFLRRESDVVYTEQDGAETYQHVGGMYRLITTPT